MSSDEGDDELEERANDLWGMDEVRGGGGASTVEEVDSETTDTSDTADTAEGSDMDEPDDTPKNPASDTADTPDASLKTDTQRSAGGTESDTVRSDTADTSDTADSTDISAEKRTEATSSTDPVETSNKVDTTDTADTADIADTTDASPTDDSTDRGSSRPSGGTVTGEDPTVRQLWRAAEAEGVTVRDLHNVNVYLYEDIYDEMRRTFKQLDAEYLDVHGEDLSKNKAFFNAVFRAGLNSPELREELELD